MYAKHSRIAVTFIEVIFSIGVVLIGLVGLLSILPLAGRRAQDSVTLATAAEYGSAVMSDLLAGGFLHNADSATHVHLGLVVKRLGEAVPREHVLVYEHSTAAIELQNRRMSPIPPGGLPGDFNVTAFCIDPMLVASNAGVPDLDPTAVTSNFNEAMFPYFSPQFDPLKNPAGPLDSSPDTSATWPTLQPRLLRVGFVRINPGNPFALPPVPPSRDKLSLEQARTVAENSDDLVVDRPKDRSLDARLPGIQSGTNLRYGRRIPSGEYSWIATVSPLPGFHEASISVVVLRNRDSQSDVPSTFPSNPQRNAINERLAYVCEASGFKGGSGGSVRIAASQGVLDSVVPGSWIMLSRRVSATPPVLDVHRWFRVVSKQPEATEVATNGTLATLDSNLNCFLPDDPDAPPPRAVWTQVLYLDGPDWDFGFRNAAGLPISNGDATFIDNTYATLMSDVVSVSERIVRIEEL